MVKNVIVALVKIALVLHIEDVVDVNTVMVYLIVLMDVNHV